VELFRRRLVLLCIRVTGTCRVTCRRRSFLDLRLVLETCHFSISLSDSLLCFIVFVVICISISPVMSAERSDSSTTGSTITPEVRSNNQMPSPVTEANIMSRMAPRFTMILMSLIRKLRERSILSDSGLIGAFAYRDSDNASSTASLASSVFNYQ
jgi:hypothetical protein